MQDLVEQLAKLLEERRMLLATAESCTGGLLAATITHRPGTSAIFERGFVTYSNEAKIEMLGVPKEIIDNHGAVSNECAEAMAKGVLEYSRAHLSVSITGIAGPDGGTDTKPVGLVYFGYALRGGSSGSLSHTFAGSRNEIRTQAAVTALKHLISVVREESATDQKK
jgi:nicotinamide-nucleotide amidase